MTTFFPAAMRSRMLDSLGLAGRQPARQRGIERPRRGRRGFLHAGRLAGDGRETANGLRHGRDLRGPGAATAADQPRALRHEFARDAGKIGRIGIVEEATVDVARIAGVRKRRKQIARLHLNVLEHAHGGLRALQAIDAHDFGALRPHARERLLQRKARREMSLRRRGKRADRRNVAGQLDLRRQRVGHFIGIEESLEDDDVGPRLEQHGNLLAKDGASVPAVIANFLEGDAGGSDAAGDVRAGGSRGDFREARRGEVDVAEV